MKFVRFILLFLVTGSGFAQSLRDINYNYLYNPDEPVRLDLFASRSGSEWTVHYRLVPRDTSAKAQDLSIEWGIRDNINDKESRPFLPEEISGILLLHNWTIICKSRCTVHTTASFRYSVINTEITATWMPLGMHAICPVCGSKVRESFIV